MKVSELKEWYLNLFCIYNERYDTYKKIIKDIEVEECLMSESYKNFKKNYISYNYANKNIAKAEKNYLEFCTLYKNELNFLLNLLDDFNEFFKIEKKIDELTYKSKSATKIEYYTEYVTEYYTDTMVIATGVVLTTKSRIVEKEKSKKVPDLQARKEALIEMEKLKLQLENSKYYEIFKEYRWLIKMYLDVKDNYLNLKSRLNYNSLEWRGQDYINHQSKLNEYIKALNEVVLEIEKVKTIAKKIEKLLKKKFRFSFIKNNTFKDFKLTTRDAVNLTTVEDLLNRVKNECKEKEEIKDISLETIDYDQFEDEIFYKPYDDEFKF